MIYNSVSFKYVIVCVWSAKDFSIHYKLVGKKI